VSIRKPRNLRPGLPFRYHWVSPPPVILNVCENEMLAGLCWVLTRAGTNAHRVLIIVIAGRYDGGIRIDVIFAGFFYEPGRRLVLVVARPYVAAVRGFLVLKPNIRTNPRLASIEPDVHSLIEPSIFLGEPAALTAFQQPLL